MKKRTKIIVLLIILLSLLTLATVVRARYIINKSQSITISSATSNVEVSVDSTGAYLDSTSEIATFTVTIKNNNDYDITCTVEPSNSTLIVTGGITNVNLPANTSKDVTITVQAKEGYLYTAASENVKINVNTTPYKLATNNLNLTITTFPYEMIELINANYTPQSENNVDFAANVTDADSSGLFTSEDESGETLYFRGVIDNNYVYFADMYWRIVRINGDGTYRIILDGTTGKNAYNTVVDTTYNNVGFMYSTVSSSNYNPKTNTNKSAIMTYLEEWYTTSGLVNYDEYIDKDAIFWNDRTVSSSTSTQIIYAGWTRMLNKTPTLDPGTVVDSGLPTADLFSVTTKKGNGKLTRPIGLITADEIVKAGGTIEGSSDGGYGTYYDNRLYYLYSSDLDVYGFWTMTPRRHYINNPANSHVIVSKPQAVIYSEPSGSGSRGVKPVINLKSTIKVKGTGTKDDPYVIKSLE